MKNILSYKPGTVFSGQEIIDWAEHQVKNKTSHYKHGRRIMRLYGKTLNPSRLYNVLTQYESWHCGNGIHKPLVVRVGKELLSYWSLLPSWV